MRFHPLSIQGAGLLELQPLQDERGSFTRTFCGDELAAFGLDGRSAQCNESWSKERGTLRGMHFMGAPKRETKTLRVVRGAVWDVVADIRRGSPTFLRWAGTELRAGDGRMIHVPAGCAHGFLTLEADTVVQYVISEPYDAACYRGLRWDDPALAIQWPFPPSVLHPRDASFSTFEPDRDAT